MQVFRIFFLHILISCIYYRKFKYQLFLLLLVLLPLVHELLYPAIVFSPDSGPFPVSVLPPAPHSLSKRQL